MADRLHPIFKQRGRWPVRGGLLRAGPGPSPTAVWPGWCPSPGAPAPILSRPWAPADGAGREKTQRGEERLAISGTKLGEAGEGVGLSWKRCAIASVFKVTV